MAIPGAMQLLSQFKVVLLTLGRHAAGTVHMVVLQLTRLLAMLLKRGWASEGIDAHRGFFDDLEHKVVSQGGAAVRRVNIEILEVRGVLSHLHDQVAMHRHVCSQEIELACTRLACLIGHVGVTRMQGQQLAALPGIIACNAAYT